MLCQAAVTGYRAETDFAQGYVIGWGSASLGSRALTPPPKKIYNAQIAYPQ